MTEEGTGVGNIGYIRNGSWVMYSNLNFGSGAQSFKAKIAGNTTVMELYLDSMSGSPAAKVSFSGNGNFNSYEEIEASIPKLSGTHDLYIRFTGGDGYLVNLDSFVFGREAVPLSGKLFKNVQVTSQANPDFWQIVAGAAVGSPLFGDRTFKIAELQSDLAGAEQLLTSCDAKGTTGEAASFIAGSDMSLYVGIDSRVEKVPDWLSDYTLMRTLCKSDNDVTFMMYRKDVRAGENVSLGSNGQTYQCVNYIVMAVAANTVEPPVNYGIGDINKDGAIGVADLVILMKHILADEIMSKEQSEQADMNSDGEVDIFDVVELRKTIILT